MQFHDRAAAGGFLDGESSAKQFSALFHCDKPKAGIAAFPILHNTNSEIPDRNREPVGAEIEADLRAHGFRVLCGVVQRFLNDAEAVNGGLAGDAPNIAIHIQSSLNAGLLLKQLGVPIETFHQTVVVEHGRMQHLRERSHFFQRFLGDLPDLSEFGA